MLHRVSAPLILHQQGIMEVGLALGIGAGPAIGGLLYHVGGFMMPFVVVGGVLVAMVPFLICAFQRGDYYSKHQIPSNKRSSVLPFVSSLWFFMITSMLLFNFLCIGVIVSTLAVYLKKFGLVSRDIGLVLSTGLIGTALFSPMAGIIVQKTGMYRFQATFGILIVNFSILLIGPAPFLPFLPQRKVWLVVVAVLVYSLGRSLLYTSSVSLLFDLAIDNGLPDTVDTHGLVSGILTSVIGAGISFGALIGPPLADRYGLEWVASGLTMPGTALVILSIACMVYTRCTKDGQKHNYTQLSTTK